jgi:hypothetical protein
MCGIVTVVTPPTADRSGALQKSDRSRRVSPPRSGSGQRRAARWRVWAVPVLAVLTVWAAVQIGSSPTAPAPAGSPPAPAAMAANEETRPPDAASVTEAITPTEAPDAGAGGGIVAAALPPGADIVPAGTGTWHVVPGNGPVVGNGPDSYTYTVEVEDGLQPKQDDQAFAAAVDTALSDPRSWTGGGQVRMQRVDTGTPSFRVSLTSQLTIRAPELCGWDIPLEASCYNQGADQRVFINDARWIRGASAYAGDLPTYRMYAINHEVGHALSHDHEPCPQNDAPAPVMMPQSWSTANNDLNLIYPDHTSDDGNVCTANPYPYPDPDFTPAVPATGPPTPTG